jgi:hypothetical protein
MRGFGKCEVTARGVSAKDAEKTAEMALFSAGYISHPALYSDGQQIRLGKAHGEGDAVCAEPCRKAFVCGTELFGKIFENHFFLFSYFKFIFAKQFFNFGENYFSAL